MNRHGRGDDRPHGEHMTSVHEANSPGTSARARLAPNSSALSPGLRERLEPSPLAIAIVEGETHTLRYVNPAFRRLTGTDAETVLGRSAARALARLGAERIGALLQRVDAGEAVSDMELEVEAGGEPAWWSVTAWPVSDRRGGRGDLVVQLRDVTDDVLERRRGVEMVAQLQAVNERLLLAALREEELTRQTQAASEAKSTFLATMSHELRTPLTAIIGYEELLAHGITGPVTEAQQSQLGRIKVSAVHLLSLIDEVLMLAHIDTRRETVHAEPVDVARLRDELGALVTPLANGKPLTLRLDAPSPPITLESDPIKVRQILVHLLSNAVRFTDRGEVSLTIREERGWALFQVRDTGIGIRPEYFERVFDEFWQVEQRPTRTVGGSGLGLAIARRLARMLGGDVSVESEYGEGSTFTLRLPLHSRGVAGAEGAAKAPGEPGPSSTA